MSSDLGIWLIRPESEMLASLLQKQLGGTLYQPWLNPAASQKDQFANAYRLHRQWIMIAASGIAVRFLDGLTNDKHHDPA
ncbi:MAG: cobalamin biosynthesis protein CbiG, partial [Methylococcales bacterium]